MSAFEDCRTAAWGDHVKACEDCWHWRIAYNNCRNRHCPKCQDAGTCTWLAEREADLLPFGVRRSNDPPDHRLRLTPSRLHTPRRGGCMGASRRAVRNQPVI